MSTATLDRSMPYSPRLPDGYRLPPLVTQPVMHRARRSHVRSLLTECVKLASGQLYTLFKLIACELVAGTLLCFVLPLCWLAFMLGGVNRKIAYSTMKRRRMAHSIRMAPWRSWWVHARSSWVWRYRNYRMYRKVHLEQLAGYADQVRTKRGRHSMPMAQNRTRYTAFGLIAVVLLSTFVSPMLHSSTPKPSRIELLKLQDLATPVWAPKLVARRALVNEVSHSNAVFAQPNGHLTSVLPEQVTTRIVGDQKSVSYTHGNERLLYVLILMGESDKQTLHNLCPFEQPKPLNDRDSLTKCGNRVTFIGGQLLQTAGAQKRYGVANSSTLFAYDLAYNWVSGTVSTRKDFAANFVSLYMDWSKSFSPTYNKLQKES